MQQNLLPLFPLRLVLLPGAHLPLHIFEDRYKEMIGEAIRLNTEFGIVLANEKGIVNIGCTAVVERVLKRYDDGRMDILARGQRRFEILMVNEEKAFLRGAVEFFGDEDTRDASPEARAKVEQDFSELKRLETDPEQKPLDADAPLSFQVAQWVSDLSVRQAMLNSRSEAERIERLAGYLPEAVEKLRTLAHIRTLVPRNGHAKHIQS